MSSEDEHLVAEVVAIGDELTSGQRLDTNSQWLSERLGELGVRVLFHTTVGDDLPANVQVFQAAFERADIVVCTGGLGPTADDLTREALAAATGATLELNENALAHVEGIFARRGRQMPERNRVQAMFPAGSRMIHNPHGTAPGVQIEIERAGRVACRVFAFPGVPDEMKEMWSATVAPLIAQAACSPRVIRHRRLKCFGAGESHLEAMLPDLIRRGREPTVGITVSQATITLRITAAGSTPDACLAAMAPTEQLIREKLGTLIFGEEDDELEHAIGRLLQARQQTLATVEWGTAGLIAERLGECAEVGDAFLGGQVIRSERAAANWLGVSQELLDRHEPHEAAVAEAMAAAGRNHIAADLVLAVAAFPSAGDTEGDVPQIHYALATSSGVRLKAAPFAAHPAILRPLCAKQAMNLVRLHLLNAE